MTEKRRKAGGRFTEPDLPDRVICQHGAVTIQHFYRGGDHGPPHLHVSGGGAPTRIGQNGRPLKGDLSLTAAQEQAIDEYRTAIRKALRKIGRWHWFDRLPLWKVAAKGATMAIANANDKPITLTLEPPVSAAAAALIRNAVHQHLAAGNLEAVRWFCSHPETPEDVLLELCDLGVCLDELGHRKGPRKLLEKMAEEYRYDEAILTLAMPLFEDPAEPAAAFANFLERHSGNDWLLETLARRGAASSDEKEATLLAAIIGHARETEFRAMRHSRELTRLAAETRDIAEMQRLFAAADPQVWLALASNRAAPRDLLDKLAEVEGVKNARDIRILAVQNLRSR